MRDPRLLEIDFLMDLDQEGALVIRTSSHSDTSGVLFGDKLRQYGVEPHRFRDLVIGLVIDGCIAYPPVEGGALTLRDLERRADLLVGVLTSGHKQETVVITHRGRVRLWDLRDELLRDAEVEPMGLRNKAAWERDLALRLRWASADEPLSIIFLDLDNFGVVNKQLGATVGDDVLRATFDLTKNLVGGRGQVYRFGGEEVGILLPSTMLETAHSLAENLRRTIEVEVLARVPNLHSSQTASFGVAAVTKPIESREAVDRVDALMRTAKQQGKNQVVVEGA